MTCRHRNRTVWAVLLILGWATLPVRADFNAATRIDSIVHNLRYREARWGILAVDARSGETLYEHQADQLFLPASTAKLFLAAAALNELGPDFRFETPVYRKGAVVNGRLQGDLVLVAQGDLTLGGRNDADGHLLYRKDDHTYSNSATNESELTDTDPLAGLKSLARQVAATGIREVAGQVLIDDRLFEQTKGNGSGPVLLSPMVVNDNIADILIVPASQPGEWARVRLRPETRYLTMDAGVITVPTGERTEVIVRTLGKRSFQVRGQIAQGSRPLLRFFDIAEPANFARALFIEALKQAGVQVDADPLQPPQAALPDAKDYNPRTRVAVFTSPPFAELLKVTMKISSNLYANTFPLLMAAKHGKRTLADGLELQRQFLKEAGVDVETSSVATASGGSKNDAVSPRAVIQLLQGLSRKPNYELFLECLPVLGRDGTLDNMVSADSPARGKVRAKTGTYYLPKGESGPPLLRSKALAGVMTTAKGRPIFFAIFLNDLVLPQGTTPNREGRVLGRLCEILYEGGFQAANRRPEGAAAPDGR